MINKEVTIQVKIPKYFPDYIVVHNNSLDDIQTLLQDSIVSRTFVIPIYTGEVEDIPDFSSLPESEYLVTPFYAGDNPELVLEYIQRTIQMFYDDYDAWKPVRDLINQEIQEKGFKETMRVKCV